MEVKKPDFSGYVTKNDLKCTDGRIIRKDAFKHCDGKVVPLVWQHMHTDPDNVLGRIRLENRTDGVYGYGYFNNTPKAKNAKELVVHEDITSMLEFMKVTVIEDRSDDWQEDAGICNKYSIYTNDKKYDFEIVNGYILVNNKHYKVLGYEPGWNYGDVTFAFNTNLDSYEAYTLDGTKIGDFNGLSEFEFYEIDSPLTGVDDYGYLETEFGIIYIHDAKIFYIKEGENYTYKYKYFFI